MGEKDVGRGCEERGVGRGCEERDEWREVGKGMRGVDWGKG